MGYDHVEENGAQFFSLGAGDHVHGSDRSGEVFEVIAKQQSDRHQRRVKIIGSQVEFVDFSQGEERVNEQSGDWASAAIL